MKTLLIYFIKGYQKLTALKRPCCRFYPSCSHYFLQALEKHGVFKGSCLGVKRILRCHPFNSGGHDPVP